MDEWTSCCSSNLKEGLKISKLEIANSVTKEKCKTDIDRNFLCRMMSTVNCGTSTAKAYGRGEMTWRRWRGCLYAL